MKRWTFSYESASVFAVECEHRGYPYEDEHGATQCENTHFDTESEAREHLLQEAKAGLFLAERRRSAARKQLDDATRELADAAEVLAKVMRASEEVSDALAAEEVSRG